MNCQLEFPPIRVSWASSQLPSHSRKNGWSNFVRAVIFFTAAVTARPMAESMRSILYQLAEHAELGEWQQVYRTASTTLSIIENAHDEFSDQSKDAVEWAGNADLIQWLAWCSARAAW
jgi:hypothetical protein